MAHPPPTVSGSTAAAGEAGSSSAVLKAPRSRVWRACETCRGRKIKCNGKDPCSFCQTNGKTCTFVEAADPASGSRQQISYLDHRLGNLEAGVGVRLDQVESALRELMPMYSAYKSWAASNPDTSKADFSFSTIPFESSATGPGFTPLIPSVTVPSTSSALNPTPSLSYRPSAELRTMLGEGSRGRLSGNLSASSSPAQEEGTEPRSWSDRFSHHSADSLGNLRYIGGASSFVLVEALKSLRPNTDDNGHPSPAGTAAVNIELPFFTPGLHFRHLAALPRPEAVKYPPPYVADSLVHTYFTRIHHTFPIFHQQSFIRRYMETMRLLAAGTPSTDHAFLSSLFAVFAAAASLAAPGDTVTSGNFLWAGPTEFRGLEYHEQAQLLHMYGARAGSIEHVQCLALLSMCHAGWNTLARSWILAGQAVRVAQDLGLHRSPRRLPLTPLEKEIRRRVWHCVYGLDRVLSVSLGRPGGTQDDDCDTEFPTEVNDEDLDAWSEDAVAFPSTCMTGFVYLTKIYVVAGKIVRSAHSLSLLRKMDEPVHNSDQKTLPDLLQSLDVLLEGWVESLPNRVRFAATSADEVPEMVSLCLLAYLVYYSCVINLHRPFLPEARNSTLTAREVASLAKCVSAAKCILKIGEMVKTTIPTSHHLAFVIQYITISGVILLQCVGHVGDVMLVSTALSDAEKCCEILKDLQSAWPGARRCREIVSDLLFATTKRFAADRSGSETSADLSRDPSLTSIPSRVAQGKRAAEADLPNDHRPPSHLPDLPTTTSQTLPSYHTEEYSPLQRYPLASTSAMLYSPPDTNALPYADFDVSSFAVGQTVDTLPYGFDFLGGDLSYLLDQANQSPIGDLNAFGGPGEEAQDGQALWDALLGSAGQFH